MQRLQVNTFKSFLFLLIIFSFVSCQKKDVEHVENSTAAEILSYRIAGHTPQVNISSGSEIINVKFPETVLTGDNLVAEFTLSPGAKALVNNVPQSSGITANNFDRVLDYRVVSGTGSTEKTWSVKATNNDYSYDWGLGHFVKDQKSNNRAYEWYFDQGSTGVYSSVNCGPCATTASIKWADPSFNKLPEYARNFYGINGGWWFTTDINNYLNDNNIPKATISLSNNAEGTWEKIIKQLDQDRIVILCLDMHFVPSSLNSQYRVNKFYGTSPGWGHFLVAKGYKEVDKKRYFETYDSFSNGVTNTDGTLKGKNRFYDYTHIFNATFNWWNYAIIIAPKGSQIDPGTLRTAINPSLIPAAWGR